jgi:hypothetical protein
MAVSEPRMFNPKPRRPDLDPASFSLHYDRDSDTLIFSLYSAGRAGISIPASGYEYLRIDPITEDTIGLQIEDFLSHAVFEKAEYLELAELAGIDAEELATIREMIEQRRRAMDPAVRRLVLANAVLDRLLPVHGVA